MLRKPAPDVVADADLASAVTLLIPESFELYKG